MEGDKRSVFAQRAADIALFTTLYIVAALLSRALSPAGKTLPADIWIASGLGLAALLAQGWWMGFGLLVGAVAFSALALPEPLEARIIAGALIGAGYFSQALFGRLAFRRVLAPSIPESPRDVLIVTVIMMAAAILSAASGSVALCLTGSQSQAWRTFPELMARWWLQALAGMLLVTPALFFIIERIRGKPRRDFFPWFFGSLILGVGVLLFSGIDDADRRAVRTRFDLEGKEMLQEIRNELDDNLQNLVALESLYAASKSVEPEEFRIFASKVLSRNANILSVFWIPAVRESERAAYERALSERSGSTFKLYERDAGGTAIPAAATREEHFPIELIESAVVKRETKGYDFSADYNCLQALRDARDSGEMTMAIPLLPNDAFSKSSSVLVFMPVYSGGFVPSVEERRIRTFMGCVAGWYDIGLLVRNAADAAHHHDIEVFVFPGTRSSRKDLLGFIPSISGPKEYTESRINRLSLLEADPSLAEPLDVGKDFLLAIARPGPAFGSLSSRWLGWSIMLACVAISFSLLVFLSLQRKVRTSLERFEQLAATLQEGFWINDLVADKFEFIGSAYEKIWGIPAKLFNKYPSRFMNSILAEDRHILLEAMERNLLNETTDCDYRVMDTSGGIHDIWDRSFPVLDSVGKVIKRTGVCSDITELKKTQQALEELNRELERRVEERTRELNEREALYRGLFENSNDAIFLLSPEGKGVQANDKALELLGVSEEEFLALSAAELDAMTPRELQPDAEDRVGRLLRGEEPLPYERVFVSRGGRRAETEISLSLVRDPGGQDFVIQSVVRDITERRRAAESLRRSLAELEAANVELEKASRMKDEFLASMSHELRTPLTGILGLSEALQLQTFGTLSERQTKALRNIEESGRHLLDLINDILDLSKIEAGKFDLRPEACDVAAICQACLQLTKGMAHQKRQTVEFRMEPESISMIADPRRLKQMIVNLLSNAIKFTPDEGTLGLELAGDQAARAVEFTVWDKGIGIAPENLGKLFKPFTQIDGRLARQYAGTGLGLSLVQRMAELHGGSVKVESEPGKGSRFTVVLPWERADPA
jgi:PAS domain S-box-containing protein